MNDEALVNEQRDKLVSVDPTLETVVNTVDAVVPAGAQLAALREARGWTTAQIANQLNLAIRQIQALESDNYAALPGMVIVRGFIRAYAKVLQADPAPILAAIVNDTAAPVVLPERNTLSASFSETKLSASGPRGFSFKLMVGAAVLAMIGLAVFAGQHFGLISSSPSQISSTEEKLAPVETGEVVDAPPAQPEVIETTFATDAPSTTETSRSSVNSIALKPMITAPMAPVIESKSAIVESKPVVVAPVIPAAVSAIPLTPPSVAAANKAPMIAPIAIVSVNSKDALAIKVREDSWVEIKRADNSVLVSRLLKAGTTEIVAVTEPVSMVIGNAAGVDVTLRGKSVDVVTGNSSNVARLNLK